MSDFLSLSLFQILSVLSFLTSVLAIVRVGSGSLHRLSHRLDSDVARSPTEMPSVGGGGKTAVWSWSLSGLPTSFSLNTLIGDDESAGEDGTDLEGLSGGSHVVTVNWQASKSRPASPTSLLPNPHPPVSMAKLIMSRHTQRKHPRIPRRMPGMPRPTPPSRLMHAA